jgi:phage-related protein
MRYCRDTEWRVEILNETVKAEVAALPVDIRAKLTHILDMMVALGPQRMREPHVKPLRDKLWEMRMQGKDGIARAIYVLAHERRIVIVHAFVKKTQKTPPHALELALQRAKELEP